MRSAKASKKSINIHISKYFMAVRNCFVVFVVFFPFILDIKFIGRTCRGHTGGRSHRISHHLLSAVRALTFLARRIQPFLSLVDREVKFLCTNDLIVLHPLGIFIFYFLFI